MVVPLHVLQDTEWERGSCDGDVCVSLLSTCVEMNRGLTTSRSSIGREWTKANVRWSTADPAVVSLEILTILGTRPSCCCITNRLTENDPAKHYWTVVLSTAELYGILIPQNARRRRLPRWMTFCPEWITGSPNFDTSTSLDFWVYLVVHLTPITPPPPLFHPLKSFRSPVHEHCLGPCSTGIHTTHLPGHYVRPLRSNQLENVPSTLIYV